MALFAVFFVPIFLALYLNIGMPGWLPFGQTNHGHLIEPAARFELSGLRKVDGDGIGQDLLQGKWSLVYVEPAACLARCDRAVYRMRQTRRSMGKNIDRVQRLVVSPRRIAGEVASKLNAHDADVKVIAADKRWFDKRLPGEGSAEIYVIDPEGLMVLWYAPDAEFKGMIEDLERLLKVSKIG